MSADSTVNADQRIAQYQGEPPGYGVQVAL